MHKNILGVISLFAMISLTIVANAEDSKNVNSNIASTTDGQRDHRKLGKDLGLFHMQ